MMKQGFTFDPNGQYAYLAKRCEGIHYTGPVSANVTPISPPPPPTVITVPAIPGQHAQVIDAPASPAPVAIVTPPATTRVVARATYCQKISAARKKKLIALFRANIDRSNDLDELHAACVSDSDILSAI